MADKVIIDKSLLTGIGNAIREKKGTTALIPSISMESEIRSIQTGGGSTEPGENTCLVRYIDFDGTVLKEEYVEKGGTTTPPSNPNPDPDYLVFNSWNYDTSTYVVNQNTDIGAIYNTIDGASYFFIRVTETTSLALTLDVSNFTSIDWGDGTVDTNATHTYATGGDYIIKITGAFTFGTSGSAILMGSDTLNQCLYKCYLDNITNVPSSTFYDCRSLQSITIPDGVTSILNNAFYNCYSLQSITIPDGVTSISSSTFYDCRSLQSITIPDGVTGLLNNKAFYNCSALQSITIPDGVTRIYDNAFNGCRSLQSITIPSSVTSISSSAFQFCTSLQSITIPDGVTSILNNAFYNCYSLQSITIPDGVTSISNSAFINCYVLQSITIPDGVTSIESNAFYNCYSLQSITIDCSAVPTLSSTSAFVGISLACIFWVNDDIIEDLKVATNWSTYAAQMRPKSEMPTNL